MTATRPPGPAREGPTRVGERSTAAVGFAPCLNPATVTGSPLERFVDVAAAAGFGFVELSIQQAQAHGPERTAELLDAHGLRVAAACGILPAGPVLPEPLLIPEDRYRDLIRHLPQRLAAFTAIGCPVATIVLNPRSHLPTARARTLAVVRLRELAAAAADVGVRLAVEAVGVRTGLPPNLDGPHPVAATLPQLADLLADADHPTLSVLVDSYHWAATGADPAHITGLPHGQVAHVQIADTPTDTSVSTPPGEWTDAMRLFPGDAALPWPAFGAALAANGYTGPASVELFNPDLRALPEPEVAARAFDGAASRWTPEAHP
ncbi:sugar phosphate isomerase/epimerase [Streptomycetaceae bacterium NBC_01309]